jgi:acyl-CoA thioesterase
VAGREPWPDDLDPPREALDAVLRGSALLAHLGGELVDWGPGWAEARLPTIPAFANLAGTVHGGIVAAVGDAAFEAACNSYGRVALAAALSAHYTAPAALGVVLTATAVEVARGRRTASYRVDVVEGDGVLVAWFQALAHRTSRWHLGEDSWPAAWREEH